MTRLIHALVGALATSIIVAGAISAAPVSAPLKGKIVFTAPGGDLWTMNADGSDRRRLTRSGTATDFSPSWAPDGRHIVFRTERGKYIRDPRGSGAQGIFVINSDGTRERQVQPRTGGLFPAWSPSGKKIAYTGLTGGHESIFLMNPDGSRKQDLHTKTRAAECTTWSPDSSKITYCGHDGDGNWAVWVMNADGSGQRQLTHPVLVQPAGTGGDYPAAFSPDGRQILYSAGQHESREIYAIGIDGAGLKRLTYWVGADSPNAWLPDGQIVFGHYNGDAVRSKWFVMDTTGKDTRSLQALNRVRAADPISWLPR
ncbi:MAG: PD40 domain-containing protein [Actinobacteria bacterium]|nr:PD40 domain-containing protein [Actinomycetota bacterium]